MIVITKKNIEEHLVLLDLSRMIFRNSKDKLISYQTRIKNKFDGAGRGVLTTSRTFVPLEGL